MKVVRFIRLILAILVIAILAMSKAEDSSSPSETQSAGIILSE